MTRRRTFGISHTDHPADGRYWHIVIDDFQYQDVIAAGPRARRIEGTRWRTQQAARRNAAELAAIVYGTNRREHR